MDKRHKTMIIAGASGLVGQHALAIMLEEQAVSQIYSLVRKSTEIQHPKLQEIIHPQLQITHWDESFVPPQLGLIALGTTRKQAGSKQGLEKVDYELVCQVAQTMKTLGVKRIAIVSSLGAKARSQSHYLQCKGRMEETIRRMGFEQVTFVRPGPLTGIRKNKRTDEKWVRVILTLLHPLLLGRLRNFIPISAQDVASAMLYCLFQIQPHAIDILHSRDMLALLKKYQ
ncbi:nucleoside-diphosphate sugar epimerase [Vibrio anguillarum]|uniref:NAD(P)H-binding protein n=1 Tax=Vibrio anguillarum TaxID=55601 RepID=UPI000B539DB5|nr:NAD(P)H-binding protein [Vibrio anguillarum]ASG07591.1 nucleoside-diphosphate sugar epimerase [Vibrio anguillarum]